MIEITIRGEPVPWARAGKRGGFSFTPRKQREAAFVLGYEAKAAMGDRPLLKGAIRLLLVFTYSWPKSTSKKRLAGPNFKDTRPDIDNLVKLVCDSFNTIVWDDDAQVAHVSATKVFGPIPSISVLVSEMAEDNMHRHPEWPKAVNVA